MSTVPLKNRLPQRYLVNPTSSSEVEGLRWFEKALLFVGILEIPLQLDKYFLYFERDAKLGAVGGINISITTISLVCLYILWAVWPSKNNRKVRGELVAGLPMIFYIGVVALSIFAATIKMLSIFDFVLLIQSYGLFFYIANRVRTREDFKFLLGVFFVTALVQSFIIIGQKAIGESFYGQRVDIGPLALMVWEDGRPCSSMHSPVLAGSFLSLIWLPALAVLTTLEKGWLKYLAIAMVVFGGLAILITQTRGAILTAVVGAAAIGFACLRRGWFPMRLVAIGAIMAVISIVPLAEVIEKRITSGDNGSAEARLHLASIAKQMIERAPVFGVGAGNCHLVGESFANQHEFRALWYYTVHCKYLVVWVETGIIGLIAFLFVVSNGVRDGVTAWVSRNRFLGPIGFGLAIGIIGHMLHMIVDIFNSRTQVQTLWALLGTVAAIRMIAMHEADEALYSSSEDDSEEVPVA